MKDPNDIIICPIITEKSNSEIVLGKYTFKVRANATKTDIRNAAEQLFQVKVLKVNTMNMEGKKKRMGVHAGKRPDWKKAIIRIDIDPKPQTYLDKDGKEVTSNRRYKTSIEEFGGVQG